jgi:hypothetical protein
MSQLFGGNSGFLLVFLDQTSVDVLGVVNHHLLDKTFLQEFPKRFAC